MDDKKVAIVISITRRAVLGGLGTTRALWALGDSLLELDRAIKYCCAERDAEAWQVILVEQAHDSSPSKWPAIQLLSSGINQGA